ncbi:MAG: pyrimidine 5'-nucleotidase [Vibrionaceae bacterium]
MNYDWILFDADDTLFAFDAFRGLTQLFAEFGINFTEQDHTEYEALNRPLWKQYQDGQIDVRTLQYERFKEWGDKLDVSPLELNERFSLKMAAVCQPYAGVKDTLAKLAQKAKLGIITNGFADIQQLRLQNTQLDNFFEFVVVSELVGVAKPHRTIFEHAFDLMGDFNKSRVLMVGDNLDSDIKGANNVGIDSCWLDHKKSCGALAASPTFIVHDWEQLAGKLVPCSIV